VTTQSSSSKSTLKKEDSGKNGSYTGHLQTKNYSTGLRKSLNSSFMNTKITTSNPYLEWDWNSRPAVGADVAWTA
jgi:hypothetical protein